MGKKSELEKESIKLKIFGKRNIVFGISIIILAACVVTVGLVEEYESKVYLGGVGAMFFGVILIFKGLDQRKTVLKKELGGTVKCTSCNAWSDRKEERCPKCNSSFL